MNIHKNARSCPASRETLARRVLEQGWSLPAAAAAANLSVRRAGEWVRRYKRGEAMTDRSSRPRRSRTVPPETRSTIVELRREWLTMRRIAGRSRVSTSTISRICASAGISRLKSLDPPPPPRRYERDRPGELLHIDSKKLGRFHDIGHRVTRVRSRGSKGAGWEALYVAVDDASRLSFAELLPDESTDSALSFLERALAWFTTVGVSVDAVMTDNGTAFKKRFDRACHDRQLRHIRTRPYHPQTNGKVERMIQTLLREWAYRYTYLTSEERKSWLAPYLHFYNFHRAHTALRYHPPISRLDRNNVIERNT